MQTNKVIIYSPQIQKNCLKFVVQGYCLLSAIILISSVYPHASNLSPVNAINCRQQPQLHTARTVKRHRLADNVY